ncbi:peptide-methionine (R)-S-oxide reductase MsrB [Croceicoccus sp. Ery5]|uniref:peptide-methionine (R)-S-oxide reductase MsrB n=1 Tax=Croceicoccus sp. Ery5 TaxID=1703340 RepID=UPI001E32FAE4|nr:peptide-methionine (R)-S-oxide reductase MsrB [Croceicoccus sp. Ery5]
MTHDRRSFVGLLLAGALTPLATACGQSAEAKQAFPFTLSDAQWRKRLTAAEYRILREAGTERAFSSPLDKEKRAGIFACAGCGHRLFSSRTKYDSHTGWPSFYRPLQGAIGTSTDYKIGYPRTEVHCANCGGHLGHVFDDGPKPTGKRYCMNGLALDFIPGAA